MNRFSRTSAAVTAVALVLNMLASTASAQNPRPGAPPQGAAASDVNVVNTPAVYVIGADTLPVKVQEKKKLPVRYESNITIPAGATGGFGQQFPLDPTQLLVIENLSVTCGHTQLAQVLVELGVFQFGTFVYLPTTVMSWPVGSTAYRSVGTTETRAVFDPLFGNMNMGVIRNTALGVSECHVIALGYTTPLQ